MRIRYRNAWIIKIKNLTKYFVARAIFRDKIYLWLVYRSHLWRIHTVLHSPINNYSCIALGKKYIYLISTFMQNPEYILQESLMNWFSGCVSSEDDMARAILRDKNYLWLVHRFHLRRMHTVLNYPKPTQGFPLGKNKYIYIETDSQNLRMG